jgi:hypothetical protein
MSTIAELKKNFICAGCTLTVILLGAAIIHLVLL